MDIAAIDLFCGAGGLTHGLSKAGICVRAGVDSDPACAYPYEANNSARFLRANVEHIRKSTLLPYFANATFTLLAGCAPCQPFSTYTQGLNIRADQKWRLIYSFLGLIRRMRPDVITMENVPQLRRHRVFSDFLEGLDRAGYHIRYKTAAGKHIIVELKRPERICTTLELAGQIQKYRQALTKCLEASGERHPHIEIVCVVGEPLSDWGEPGGRERSEKILDAYNARVIRYQQLIDNAEKSYAKYLEKNKSDSALARIIEGVDTGIIFE